MSVPEPNPKYQRHVDKLQATLSHFSKTNAASDILVTWLQKIIALFHEDDVGLAKLTETTRSRHKAARNLLRMVLHDLGHEVFFLCGFSLPITMLGTTKDPAGFIATIRQWWGHVNVPISFTELCSELVERYKDIIPRSEGLIPAIPQKRPWPDQALEEEPTPQSREEQTSTISNLQLPDGEERRCPSSSLEHLGGQQQTSQTNSNPQLPRGPTADRSNQQLMGGEEQRPATSNLELTIGEQQTSRISSSLQLPGEEQNAHSSNLQLPSEEQTARRSSNLQPPGTPHSRSNLPLPGSDEQAHHSSPNLHLHRDAETTRGDETECFPAEFAACPATIPEVEETEDPNDVDDANGVDDDEAYNADNSGSTDEVMDAGFFDEAMNSIDSE
ncbi:hypothetical protein A1O3_06075 [Capronia epimyces CBS 606.96]|uniref:Uncharacterized protein n=1 Tax=Capronia epimyces CBS 606.96 TaxID=1182542 RepID=W9XNY7_9EURO|nr:uncharacterized protein A1O3_06075 [Capronia epimyces CBS 606.96]EXJ82262.1 hypothetical protein A1O3_06075 [Capronia epimyces CBS 606.96]